FQYHLVACFQLAAVDAVVQVEVETSLANTVAGELSGVGGQGGQLDMLEAGGNVERLQGVKRRQLATDADWRVAINLAFDIDFRRLLAAIVEGRYRAIELVHGGGERRSQAEVGKVPGAVADLDGAYAQRRGSGVAGGRSGGLRPWHEQFADVGAAIL